MGPISYLFNDMALRLKIVEKSPRGSSILNLQADITFKYLTLKKQMVPKSIQKGAPQFGAAFEDCGEKSLGIFNLQSSNGHHLKIFNFLFF